MRATQGNVHFFLFGECGLWPIFAADFTSASNLGHASGSSSRFFTV